MTGRRAGAVKHTSVVQGCLLLAASLLQRVAEAGPQLPRGRPLWERWLQPLQVSCSGTKVEDAAYMTFKLRFNAMQSSDCIQLTCRPCAMAALHQSQSPPAGLSWPLQACRGMAAEHAGAPPSTADQAGTSAGALLRPAEPQATSISSASPSSSPLDELLQVGVQVTIPRNLS